MNPTLPSRETILARQVIAQVMAKVERENPAIRAELPIRKWVEVEYSSLVHWTIERFLEVKWVEINSIRQLIRRIYKEALGKEMCYSLMVLHLNKAWNYLYEEGVMQF